MARGRYGWSGMLALIGCHVPEGDHADTRCRPDAGCPRELVCYRGFCVEEVESMQARDAAEPALAAAHADASVGDARAGAPDAAPAVHVAAAPDVALEDAGKDDPRTSDARGGSSAAMETHVEIAGPASMGEEMAASVDTPPQADAGSSAPPDAAVACYAPCAGTQANEKECSKCVRKMFGAKLDELCADVRAAAPERLLCALLCAGDAFGIGPQCRGQP